MVTLNELRKRGHSYRNFEPYEIAQLMTDQSRDTGREFLAWMEGGRFQPMCKQVWNMSKSLDIDEIETFWRRNPDVMRWATIWAVSETVSLPNRFKPDGIPMYPRGNAPLPQDIPY